MDFPCPGLPQKPDDLSAGGTPDNGVVNEDYPFPGNFIPDGIELDFHLIREQGARAAYAACL